MSNFGLSCDVCNRENVGITWVNGMKFCAKCYQETFGASKDWQLLDKDKTIAEQQQRIAELEEKLKNAIVSKFKVGQEVWFVSDPYTARYAKVRHMKIEEISISSIFVERGVMYAGDDWAGISESELFATKAEAEAKLKELGEKK